MATKDFTVTNFKETPHALLVTWSLAGTDEGRPIEFLEFTDRSVQVVGTFDSATVTWQGSNDGTNYQTMNDANNDAMTIATTGRTELVRELARYQRPITSGGGGSADLTVSAMIIRRRP